MAIDEERLMELEQEDEALKTQLSIDEKKALIAEAKKKYGKDWTKFFTDAHSGLDWQALKFRIR